MQRSVGRYLSDRLASTIFLICAILLVAVIVGVFYFIGSKAFLVFFEPGGTNIREFFTTTNWDPTAANSDNPSYGAAGLIIGSVVTTLLSVLIATPLSFCMALFMTELAPGWLIKILQPLLEVFTGMPSVVIGFLGLVVLVPFLGKATHASGYGWAAATIVLIIMILPTITSISIDTLRAVPGSVREASLALGSTHWQMMSKAVLPAAASGLATAVVLGMTRAIGETLAVSMVLGGAGLPSDPFQWIGWFEPATNITRQIINDFGETSGVSQDAYWTLAFLLLVISFIFICISRYFASRSVYK